MREIITPFYVLRLRPCLALQEMTGGAQSTCSMEEQREAVLWYTFNAVSLGDRRQPVAFKHPESVSLLHFTSTIKHQLYNRIAFSSSPMRTWVTIPSPGYLLLLLFSQIHTSYNSSNRGSLSDTKQQKHSPWLSLLPLLESALVAAPLNPHRYSSHKKEKQCKACFGR